MLNVENSDGGLWQKADLKTSGIAADRIKGLYRFEEHPWAEAFARWDRDTKEKYSHDEMFGKWWTLSDFLDVPVDFAWEYVSNIYSVEEWSYGIRDLKHSGGNIYRGIDRVAKNTDIFLRSEPHHDAKTVDYHYAWDQKEDLWVRCFFRFVDAQSVVNRPGTILTWFSWKHPFYDKKLPGQPSWLKDAQNKTGRVWLGDYWRYFWAWRRSEADNLRYILEHRYHSKK